MRTLATKARAINQYNGLGNQLWDLAGNRPSLDLPFADNKSLVDVTTGANLVDFTRASSGTYVDSEGVIRTAVTNLVTYSEDFNEWTLTNVDLNPDQVVAPDGTLTADEMLSTSGVTGVHRVFNTYTFSNAGDKTISVYVKNKDADGIRVNLYNSTDGNAALADIDLSDFSVSSGSATVSPVGNGWHRISLSGSYSALYSQFFIQLTEGGNNNFTGDGTGVYLWGAQLEQSTTVGEYIPTTSTINSAPRFDHNPTTGESLGLLVEEQRTNSFEWSNSATQGETWNNVGTLLNLASGQSDPAGGTAGIRATDANSDSAGTFLQRTSLANLTASTTISYSVWLKPIDCPSNAIILNVFANTTTDSIYATFSVSGTAITEVSTSAIGTGAASGASFEVFPNGWYRCRLTGVPSTVTMNDVRARVNLGSYQRAAGTARFDWYGAQLESGAFATSYIPTSGATAARAADVASISGSNFSSWYRQDEGTVFAEFNRPAAVTGLRSIAAVSDGGYNNRMTLRTDSAVFMNSFVTTGGVNQATFPLAINSGANNKAALAYATNDFNAGVNGVSGTNDTVGTVPVVDRLSIGAVLNAEPSCSYVRRLTYWPTRLGNEVLQTITQ
jgi:hypothetical protein